MMIILLWQFYSVHDDVATNEQAGIDFLTNLYSHSNWKQTYTDGTRKNYAGKGYTYDADKDAFIPQKPYDSWTLNNDTCRWIAPVDYPSDASQEKQYDWNEDSTSWVLIER
jgi:hypothetical protein